MNFYASRGIHQNDPILYIFVSYVVLYFIDQQESCRKSYHPFICTISYVPLVYSLPFRKEIISYFVPFFLSFDSTNDPKKTIKKKMITDDKLLIDRQ